MLKLPTSLQRLINEFNKLPGIGQKSAQRLGFYLLKSDNVELLNFSDSLKNLKQDIVFCTRCHNMAESDPCSICHNLSRNQKLICVVEEPLDAIALDRSGQFNGIFHVLGGVLNPMEGIGPTQLNLDSLKSRVEQEGTEEIIIATNPTLEGETTAMHIVKMLQDSPVKVTRIARGLPMGSDLEYADDVTLSRALEGRREI